MYLITQCASTSQDLSSKYFFLLAVDPNFVALGKKRGFAFVQFETREQAVKAVEKFQAHELRGEYLEVF